MFHLRRSLRLLSNADAEVRKKVWQELVEWTHCWDVRKNFEFLVFEICTACGAVRVAPTRVCLITPSGCCRFCTTEMTLSSWKVGQKRNGSRASSSRTEAAWTLETQTSRRLGSCAAQSTPNEADPRHAEILKQQCGDHANDMVTPGEEAKVTPDKLKDLPGQDVEGCRSAIMRSRYLAEQSDVQFARKEGALGMSATERRVMMLKRLEHHMHLIWNFPRQKWPGGIKTCSDSDWAVRRAMARFGRHLWISSSSTQVAISLSSAVEEFYGLVQARPRAIGTCYLAKEVALFLQGDCDSHTPAGPCTFDPFHEVPWARSKPQEEQSCPLDSGSYLDLHGLQKWHGFFSTQLDDKP